MTVPRYEYVVRWRRAAWSITTKSKLRKFDHAHHAQDFVRKLQNADGDWSELSPAIIRVDRRPVGEWESRYEWDGRP